MPDPEAVIRHPSRYVPLTALATGVEGEIAHPVTPDNPVPNAEQPYRGVRPLLPDTPIAPGKALLADVVTGGMVEMELANGSMLAITLHPGLTMLPFATSQLVSAGTTATLDAWVLD